MTSDQPAANAPNPDHEWKLIIGGDRPAGGAGTYDVINPATEEVVGRAPEATTAQAADAAAAAAEAFDAWSRTTPEDRCELLNRAAELLDAHADELVPLVQAETGATMRVAKSMQVPQASARFRRYAEGAKEPTVTPLRPQTVPATALAPGGVISAIANRAPVGVVTAISSYNFPVVNMAGKVAPALAMGNTVIMKPAPQDPLGVIRMAELLVEAGFPPGVVNCVVSEDVAPSEVLTTHDAVDMVSFTGSTAVGQRIAEVAGSRMKRLLLELGGKGACVVLDDADLKAAIGGIGSVWGFHSGQICTSPTRVIAQRGIYDQLVAGLTKTAAYMPVGDPLERGTVVGPVISAAHRERVEGYVEMGRSEGATIAAGGERPDMERGFYVAPTLLADATNDMTPVREEIFGPVVAVVPVDDAEEALAVANDSDFGLYSYVFTGDTGVAMDMAKRMRSGNVGLNTLQRNHDAPFGGFKQSGVGRDGGSYGLDAYGELQSIVWSS